VAIPFEIIIQNNCTVPDKLNFLSFLPKAFINFWLFPYFFYFIFGFCFYNVIGSRVNDATKIKPFETMWVVKRLLDRKQTDQLEGVFLTFVLLLIMLWWGFFASLPFMPFMVCGGE